MDKVISQKDQNKNSNDLLIKVGISKEANEKLEDLLITINEGRVGKKITKQLLTSFAIEKLNENALQELRGRQRDIVSEMKQYLNALNGNTSNPEELLKNLKEKFSS